MAAYYGKALSMLHWTSGPCLMASIACVLTAQNSKGKEKGTWMFRHKSLGLLTAVLVAPRIGTKLMTRFPGHLEGSSKIEQIAASASHYALYGFMTLMPITGIAMGYYGGRGLPFFATTLPGAKEPNKAIAGNAYKIHKQLGYYGKFLIPIHAGAAIGHAAKGQSIFARINPFLKKA